MSRWGARGRRVWVIESRDQVGDAWRVWMAREFWNRAQARQVAHDARATVMGRHFRVWCYYAAQEEREP